MLFYVHAEAGSLTGGVGALVATDSVRLHVYFSGTVQGVGFRYTVSNISRRHRVTGFVRNLSDGRVELVAEGNKMEVFDFFTDIEREMGGYIDRSEKTLDAATNEFPSFRITH